MSTKAFAAQSATTPLEPMTITRREPLASDVEIDILYCGVCHSDAFVKFGAFPGMEFPRVPGHEVAGVVDSLGDRVNAFEVGDRVGVGWHGGHCFQCDACRRGMFINCNNGKICGISYDGGYQEYMVAPWEAAARIPDGIRDCLKVFRMCCSRAAVSLAVDNAAQMRYSRGLRIAY